MLHSSPLYMRSRSFSCSAKQDLHGFISFVARTCHRKDYRHSMALQDLLVSDLSQVEATVWHDAAYAIGSQYSETLLLCLEIIVNLLHKIS